MCVIAQQAAYWDGILKEEFDLDLVKKIESFHKIFRQPHPIGRLAGERNTVQTHKTYGKIGAKAESNAVGGS